MTDLKKVCIIEDNFPIRKLFTNLLKKNGFEVVDYENAKDGIEWLKLNKPDIIILDILLPELSGLDAIKIIREIPEYKQMPILAVTGFAAESDREKYLGAGFDHYITKPVNVATFADEVKSFLK